MKAFNPKDAGPFTPTEAAKRVKLASQQLKWFTLCQPHWPLAHFDFDKVTAYPVPSLPIPKGVRVTFMDTISGEFRLSPSGAELVAAVKAVSRAVKLRKDVRSFFSINGHGCNDKLGLGGLTCALEGGADWKVNATVYHPKAHDDALIRSILEAAGLPAAKEWKPVDGLRLYSTRNVESLLSLTVSHDEMAKWGPIFRNVLSAQPKSVKKGDWRVSFCPFDRGELEPGIISSQKDFDGLLKQISAAGFPGTRARIEFKCTVDRVEDFSGLFQLASVCEPYINQPIAIFETEKGEQGLLLFKSTAKGIKLNVQYGPNGWENVHEILWKNNSQLIL